MTRLLIDDCWASRSENFSVEHGHPLLLDQSGKFVERWVPQSRLVRTVLFSICEAEEYKNLRSAHLALQEYSRERSGASTIVASPGHGKKSTARSRLESSQYRAEGWGIQMIGATECYIKNCLHEAISPNLDFASKQGSTYLAVTRQLAPDSAFFDHASATMMHASEAHKIVPTRRLAIWLQNSNASILYVSRDRKGDFEVVILASE